jgi:hypothetical protein
MLENELYDRMGEKFAVVKVVGSLGVAYEVTANPQNYQEVLANKLKYSQAQGIKKLLESGEHNG